METKLSVDGHIFDFICDIEPKKNEDGSINPLMPQSRYKNIKGLPLNRYGIGPFCKFNIPKKLNWMGVYILDVDGLPNYVGECKNFSERFNNGYGNISPKNCYKDGQHTNCRINNLIYNACSDDKKVRLWFLRTDNYKEIEATLRASQRMSWNLV
ncbi:hypothetical protein NO263_02515 [Gluconacetobacter entanii]|uniref:GIY-YIG domain-containing protein n=1 Tax=Gluconacetobacter entanii TaxID=108528 RepID=A0ABT3K229_9PROT|nr:hypothetical protein [Gluconacetobacter entanii]MCW4589455.1 hypothetical protein [Gluconacetobacter entanii]MCW4593155.1 hypothetical protein [Gluconacetobacter entanii]NPC90306.1 hypothetical protein [Gluconacetobacter entanii]